MTPGAIGTILNNDVTDTAHSLTATTANLFRSCMSATFSTYNMLRLNPQLFLTSLFTVPLIGAAAMTMRKFLKRVIEQRKLEAMKAASFAEERIMQLAMVKMSNREQDEVDAYAKMQEECRRMTRKEALANGMFMGFTFSASSSALCIITHLGGRAVAAKRMTSGQLTSFATYSFLLGLAASGIVKGLSEMFQSMSGAQRVYDLVHEEQESSSSSEEGAKETEEGSTKIDLDSVQSVALRNVTFGYKARPDTTILKNVSMELKRGSVVALCGKNGSGKTTIASLLVGLHKPQSGTVALLPDGINYNDLDRSTKSQLVQMVPQGAPLLNMSILDNVKYSKPNATEEEVNKALKSANCDFVSKLPGGANFVVGMHGCKLSAGQRQRLALARALVANPLVLVLDEAQSALDHEGENALEDAVLACRGKDGADDGRALLLISHRPKSLEVADVVVVIHEGQVVETGSLNDLKKNRNSALCRLMPDLLKL
jgi:ABC-type multidrug transport system fused ATPase/permease subunit